MTKAQKTLAQVIELAKEPIHKLLEDRVAEPIVVDEFSEIINDIDSSVSVEFSNSVISWTPTRKLILKKWESDEVSTQLIINTSARWNELQHNVQMDITNDLELILNILKVSKTRKALYAFGTIEDYEYASFKKQKFTPVRTKEPTNKVADDDEVRIESVEVEQEERFSWTVEWLINYLQLKPAKSGKCYFNTKDMPSVVKLIKEEKPSKAEYMNVFWRNWIAMGNLTEDNPDFMWLDFISKELPWKIYWLGSVEKFNITSLENWKASFAEFQSLYK